MGGDVRKEPTDHTEGLIYFIQAQECSNSQCDWIAYLHCTSEIY